MTACVVCGDPSASKHYGQTCCSGCKGFFRRSVRFRRQYVCVFEDNCVVRGNARNSCRACRYRICLEQGLQPTLVHSDRACDADAPQRAKAARGKPANARVKLESSQSPPATNPTPTTTITATSTSRTSPENEEDLPSVPSTSSPVLSTEVKAEAERECELALVTAPKCFGTQRTMPLGVRNLVPGMNRTSARSVLRFLHVVDSFVDGFHEAAVCLRQPERFAYDMELSMEDAFCYEPGKMCERSMMLWKPDFPITDLTFKPMWCRVALHYVDWITHLPELQELDAEDRLKLIVGRCVPVIWHIIAHRSMPFAHERRILLSGGSFFELDEEKVRQKCGNAVAAFCLDIGRWTWDAFIEPALELAATDSELVLLRTVAAFSVVPGLSAEGKRVVRRAQAFYRATLQQCVRQAAPGLSERAVADRMSDLLALMAPIERCSQIEDNHITVMALFNLANMQSNLMYDFYVRRSMRS